MSTAISVRDTLIRAAFSRTMALPMDRPVHQLFPVTSRRRPDPRFVGTPSAPTAPPPGRSMSTSSPHGDAGPGSSWVLRAEVGSVAGLAGEQKTVAGVRPHQTGALGAEKRSVYHCAYWILGRARG